MSLFSTFNYLVPSVGKTSAYSVQASALVGSVLDFTQVSNNSGVEFNPSGVQIDNTSGTVPVVLVVQPSGFKITCPVGKQMGLPFPAPQGVSVSITADAAVLVFVDYPVLPYQF